MTASLDALLRALPPAPPPTRDIAGRALGAPRAAVRPTDTASIAALVAAAAHARVSVVPYGARTAYWWPLELTDAIGLDLTGLDDHRFADGVLEAGAGALIRPIDLTLRAAGHALAWLPDAFGDTPIGGAAAMAGTSGIGMAQGPFSRTLTGLEVVTGEGRVLRTGASGAWPHLPMFLRDGVPDLTGLLLGSEGAFGVITRVWLRPPLAPWLVHLRGVAPLATVEPLLEVGQRLAALGVLETLRAVRQSDGEHPGSFVVDAWATSPWSPAEAAARAEHARAELHRATGATFRVEAHDAHDRAGRGPRYEARWSGPMGAHAAFAERAALLGLDVNAPWPGVAALIETATDLYEAKRRSPHVLAARMALYLAPDFLNLGLHAAASHAPEAAAWAAAFVPEALGRLWGHGVIPYRVGRSWPQQTLDALDPHVRDAWTRLRRALDPAGVLHPSLPLLASASGTAGAGEPHPEAPNPAHPGGPEGSSSPTDPGPTDDR